MICNLRWMSSEISRPPRALMILAAIETRHFGLIASNASSEATKKSSPSELMGSKNAPVKRCA